MFNLQQDIQNAHPPFSLDTTFDLVKAFFTQTTFTHFPVVDQGVFLGNISLNDAITVNPKNTVGENRLILQPFFARDTMNWLEILELFSKNETSVMPVLNAQNTYLGYWELSDVLYLFYEMPFLKEAGSVLMVEKNTYDYSMSQVVQIVESHNAKLLSVAISNIDAHKIQITIKMIGDQVSEILQSFRRYGYDIVSQHTEDSYMAELKERSAYLDKYLNM